MRFSVISAEGDEQMKVEVAQPLDPSDKEKKRVQSDTEAHKPWLPYVVSAALTEINAYKDVALWIDLLFHLILWIGTWVCQIVYIIRQNERAGLQDPTIEIATTGFMSFLATLSSGTTCGAPQEACSTMVNTNVWYFTQLQNYQNNQPVDNVVGGTTITNQTTGYFNSSSSESDDDYIYADDTASAPIPLGLLTARLEANVYAGIIGNSLSLRRRRLSVEQLNYTFGRELSESDSLSTDDFGNNPSVAITMLHDYRPPERPTPTTPPEIAEVATELASKKNPDSLVKETILTTHKLCKVPPRMEIMKFPLVTQKILVCQLWHLVYKSSGIEPTCGAHKSYYTYDQCLAETSADTSPDTITKRLCYRIPANFLTELLTQQPRFLNELVHYDVHEDYWKATQRQPMSPIQRPSFGTTNAYARSYHPVGCWDRFNSTKAENTFAGQVSALFLTGSTVTYSTSSAALLATVLLHLLSPSGIVRGRLIPLLLGLIVGCLTASIVFDVIEVLRSFGAHSVQELVKMVFVSFKVGSGTFNDASLTMESMNEQVEKITGANPRVALQWAIALLTFKLVLRKVVVSNLQYPKE